MTTLPVQSFFQVIESHPTFSFVAVMSRIIHWENEKHEMRMIRVNFNNRGIQQENFTEHYFPTIFKISQ